MGRKRLFFETAAVRPTQLVAVLLLLLAPSACRERPDITTMARPVMMDSFQGKQLEAQLLKARKDKDEQFRVSSDSPVPPQLRLAFQGLEYYPIDWRFRYEGPVNRYPQQQKVQMVETDGKKRDAVRYGYIVFPVNDEDVQLQVYKLLDVDQKNLFIPFIDANAGRETYPAGRYIDLVEKANGVYVIDFNAAYNPYCAYGGDYICPVTPQENKLSVAVPAGEKILRLAGVKKHS